MNYRVVPESLNSFAQNVHDLGRASETAKSYCDSSFDLPEIGGVFGHLKSDHDKAIAKIKESVSRLNGLLQKSAQELDKVHQLYVETDAVHARDLDNIYPKR